MVFHLDYSVGGSLNRFSFPVRVSVTRAFWETCHTKIRKLFGVFFTFQSSSPALVKKNEQKNPKRTLSQMDVCESLFSLIFLKCH